MFARLLTFFRNNAIVIRIRMPKESREKIHELAHRHELFGHRLGEGKDATTELFQAALANYELILKARLRGARVFVHETDGTERELVQ